MEDPRTGIVPGGNHALLVGMVSGALMKAGLTAEPIMDEDDYTNEIRVKQPSGTYIVAVYAENARPD